MSDAHKELVNGLDDTTQLGGAVEDALTVVCDSCGADTRPRVQVVIPPGVVSASAAILSVGIVVALLYFMQLCFAHPSEATTIVPLLLTVLTWVATRMYERNKRSADAACSNCPSIEPNKAH